MPDPNALYDDMEKLNALFEELCWDCDDELMFSHDGSKVIITNKTQELEVAEEEEETEKPVEERTGGLMSRSI